MMIDSRSAKTNDYCRTDVMAIKKSPSGGFVIFYLSLTIFVTFAMDHAVAVVNCLEHYKHNLDFYASSGARLKRDSFAILIAQAYLLHKLK